MGSFLEDLRNENCDVDGAMERCLNDESFYLSCLKEVFKDTNFEKIGIEIKKGNIDTVFECSHSLKGVVGNLGITPLYNKLIEIVNDLRNGNTTNIERTFEDIIEIRNKFASIINKY